MYKLGENVASKKYRNPKNVRKQCRGEPCVRPRTKTGVKPIFENELETFASDIGSQTIVVQRANTRFAPTLLSDIGWISITTIYPKIYDRLLIHLDGEQMGSKKKKELSDSHYTASFIS
jgi:hypothetical protein